MDLLCQNSKLDLTTRTAKCNWSVSHGWWDQKEQIYLANLPAPVKTLLNQPGGDFEVPY